MSDVIPPQGPGEGLPPAEPTPPQPMPAELPPQPPAPATPSWDATTPQPETPKNETGLIIAISVGVVVAVIVAFALIGGNNSSSTSSNNGGSGGSNTFSDGHFSGHGVTFDYPSSWSSDENPTLQSQTGNKLWNVAVLPSSGRNLVIVAAYQLQVNVTSSNLPALEPQLKNALQGMAQQMGGAIQGDLNSATVDGSPALTGTISEILDGASYTEYTTFVFKGTTEYQIACQYDANNASTITSGCSQIVSSFHAS
jgi:hypothetical protein